MPDTDFHDPDLARWLQEAGRRRTGRSPEVEPAEPVEALREIAAAEAVPAALLKRERAIAHPRELILFALAAVAFQSYFFADVYLQIYSLNSVIVFV